MNKSKTNLMLDLFFMEAKGQSSVLEESLAALKEDISNKDELDSLLRASSSLKAAAKLASLESVFELIQSQETFFTLATQNKLEITLENITFIQSAVDLVLQLINEAQDDADGWLKTNKTHLAKTKENIEELTHVKPKAISKQNKKASEISNANKDNKDTSSNTNNSGLSELSMLELFRMEADTQTRTLTDGLLELENTPNNLAVFEQ